MAYIVYQTNSKTGMVYAYRAESYRDPITKKPTSRRTYLGRVDPVTKEIVEKAEEGKRNRAKLGVDADPPKLTTEQAAERIAVLEEQVRKLQEKVSELQTHCRSADALLVKIGKLASDHEQMLIC